jgi:hypothetical protein
MTNEAKHFPGGIKTPNVTISDPTEGQSLESIGGVLTPVNIPTLIKNYVDQTASSFHITEYFSAVASSIGGIYYAMESTVAVAGNVVSAAITSNTLTNIYNFATIAGQPHLTRLLKGPYELHSHLFKTGNRTITVYYELHKRVEAGTETLIATSNTSTPLGTTDSLYEFVINVDTEVALVDTDRLVLKKYATSTGSAGNTTVTTVVGGVADSNFKIDIEGSELASIFVPFNGAQASLYMGANLISAASYLAAGGTAAAPAYTWALDTDSGLYRIGANSFGGAVGGVAAWATDDKRNFIIGATTGTARFQVVQGTAGVGTVSVSGTAVTGVGTQFTNTFKVGDTITVTTTSGAETKAITAVTSDTVLATALERRQPARLTRWLVVRGLVCLETAMSL